MKFQMLAAGGGSIVNVGSIYGRSVALLRRDAYTASKHGIVGLTRSVAQEYAAQNIRINAVSPGVVRTALTDLNPARTATFAQGNSLKRIAEPEELANVITFCLSDEASFMIGAEVIVDGGFTLR